MTETFHDRVTMTLSGGVADVRLTRPDKLNALDPAMFDGIEAVLARLNDAADVRCVVLSGEGRAFCAGLDLASMGSIDAPADIMERSHKAANIFQHVAWGWRTLPMPVIAAVQGIAFGGGLQIMSGADSVIAAPGTRMGVMEIKWGIVPDMAGFALWKGRVRDDHLRELAYTGREFTAEDGLAMGFVSRIDNDPHGAAMALATQIAGRNPHAVRGIKRLANAAPDKDADKILLNESHEQQQLLGSKNQMEAIAANMQKRTPDFDD